MRALGIVIAAALMAAASLQAQTVPGTWRWIPSFTNEVESVVETPSTVYYLAGGSLFCIDKEDDSNRVLTPGSGLSDTRITLLRYNPEGGYLAVAYESGVIDMFYDNEEVSTLFGIVDSDAEDKRINDLAFNGNELIAATAFGVVSFDTDRLKVKKYGIYADPVDALTIEGGKLIVSIGDKLYRAPSTDPAASVSDMRSLGSWRKTLELQSLGDGYLLGRHEDKSAIYYLNSGGWVEGVKDHAGTSSGQFSAGQNGEVYFTAADKLFVAEKGGNTRTLATLPYYSTGNIYATLTGSGSVWMLSADGISNYVGGGDSGWSVAMQPYRPDAMSVVEAGYIIEGSSPERVYFTNLGHTYYRLSGQGNTSLRQATTLLSGNSLKDVTADDVFKAPTRLAEDPADPSVYYLGTAGKGLIKIKDGKTVGKYDESNSPMDSRWGAAVYEVSFDREGNMWVGAKGLTDDRSIMVLPAAKVALDPAAISKSDWYLPPMDYDFSSDIRIFHCRHSDMVFIFDIGGDNILAAYDNGGTPSVFTDDRYYLWKSFTDQDGRSFSPQRVSAICEDSNGHLWIGCSGGVIEITDPKRAVDPSMSVRRLKVEHTDGTGLADYLCESDNVFDISIDGAGRKWVATKESGVYVVAADGSGIVDNFTSSNSPLPSDRVNAVYCSPLTNSVYLATPSGVMEYGNTVGHPAEQMESLKIYPNPVTPEFSGYVTVEGLSEGALVKISDVSGTVVWQKRSEGGMVRWPAEDHAGRRVSTGVYYILASPASGASGKAVTGKVLVVN